MIVVVFVAVVNPLYTSMAIRWHHTSAISRPHDRYYKYCNEAHCCRFEFCCGREEANDRGSGSKLDNYCRECEIPVPLHVLSGTVKASTRFGLATLVDSTICANQNGKTLTVTGLTPVSLYFVSSFLLPCLRLQSHHLGWQLQSKFECGVQARCSLVGENMYRNYREWALFSGGFRSLLTTFPLLCLCCGCPPPAPALTLFPGLLSLLIATAKYAPVPRYHA